MISVIIPNYNNAHYLRHAIQSVLDQTFTDYEIIVVDDGSTDNSKDAVDAFGDKVRYIWQENMGLGGARNTGILASSAEFIGLLDADDEWKPDYLEKMMALANRYPDASVFYCMARCMNVYGVDLPQLVGGPPVEPRLLHRKLLRANFIIPSTVTFRRQTIIEAGNFDSSLRSCEDWDLWLRILPASLFAGIDEVLVRYRVHEQSLSANVDGMHVAKKAVVIKHFGTDDGCYETWSPSKKLAYAGLYCYFLVTSVQRRGDWQMGSEYLRNAFTIDPAKTLDVDLFYELALGTQPAGYRGSTERIALEANAAAVIKLLGEVFQTNNPALRAFKRPAYSTACYAIGLVAYNTGHLALSRSHLWRAGWYRPVLWVSSSLPGLWAKSLLGGRLLNRLRRSR